MDGLGFEDRGVREQLAGSEVAVRLSGSIWNNLRIHYAIISLSGAYRRRSCTECLGCHCQRRSKEGDEARQDKQGKRPRLETLAPISKVDT